MSRPTSEWTASMRVSNDHPEMRRLYANGGGVAQEWLADQIVKHCSAYGLKEGQVSLADIKNLAAGKVSRPTLNKYIQDLLQCGALERRGDQVFYSPIAERICGSFTGRGNKMVRNCKNSYTPKNPFDASKNMLETQNAMPRPVPDLERDLSKNLKADELPPTAAGSNPVAVEVKSQVARQAGSSKKQSSDIADTILSMGMFASGRSMQDLMGMQAVDLDALDTEAILAQDRQEAALLATNSTCAGTRPAKAADGPPQTAATPTGEVSGKPSVASHPPQRLPKSIIRHALEQMAEAVPNFQYGEKEVNALRKWPVTEAQLVDLKNGTVARKRSGSLTMGVGAYLYGAVRRASLGILPTGRGVGAHLATALGSQAGPLP